LKTSPAVNFGLYDLDIKASSSLTCSNIKSFAKPDDLRTGNVWGLPLASFETDFWLLDGNFKLRPTDDADIHAGVVGLYASDGAGDLTIGSTLTIDFDSPQSTESLTIHFSPATGDYATSIRVAYYDPDLVLIQQDDYTPTGTEFTTNQAIASFLRIRILFFAVNRADRFVRVTGIDYGLLVTFTGSSIKAASVVEETDPISAEVRGNTCDLTLFSSDAQFNMFDPTGYYAALKERQPLSIYEVVNNARVFMGQYYLDTWKNTSDTEIQMTGVDLIGLMDKITYYGGLWSGAGTPVEDLLATLLGDESIPYELDTTLEGTAIIGWLPVCTLREAIQQIAFAVGASVDCSRSWVIKIYASKIATVETSTAVITKAEKGAGSSLELQPAIAGVEVTAHNYIQSTTTQELYNGSLAAGSFEILFNQPMWDLSATGATIAESGTNYAVLTVASPGTVTLSGKLITDTVQTYKITNPDVTSSIRPVLRVKDATLVHPANMATAAQRVYDYHTQRYLQKAKLFAPIVTVGQVVDIDTLYNRQLRGVIEKMSIDLARGMVAQVEIVGAEAV
jgi:hypothetical protein